VAAELALGRGIITQGRHDTIEERNATLYILLGVFLSYAKRYALLHNIHGIFECIDCGRFVLYSHRDHKHFRGRLSQARLARLTIDDLRGWVCLSCNTGPRALWDRLDIATNNSKECLDRAHLLQTSSTVDGRVVPFQNIFNEVCYNFLKVARPEHDWRWLLQRRVNDWLNHANAIKEIVSSDP